MAEKLYIILPCYNEEEILFRSAERVREVLRSLVSQAEDPVSPESRILFVDDGSKDGTWDIIASLHEEDHVYSGLKLAKNYGHQTAIFAGMEAALKEGADCMVTIDADLQQDINALPEFLGKMREGADIVYGIRDSRDTDGFFKRSTATMYYGLMNALGVHIIPQSADYRLMTSRAVAALSEYKEHNLFIRGLVPDIGFKSDSVYFHVSRREAGSSKYTLKKMISLALDGITSAFETGIHVRDPGFSRIPCDDGSYHLRPCKGSHGSRMVHPDHKHLASGRSAAPVPGYTGGIHWQDLYGVKEASQVFCERFIKRRSRRRKGGEWK